jgi:putative chitinase
MYKLIEKLLQLFFGKTEEVEVKQMLSLEQLYKINGNLNKNECEYYLESLNVVLPNKEINTSLRLCHFLAQIIHESGHFKYKSENLNYSAKALRSVFGKYFKTDAIANEYARKPEKIANRVYANRMGNGDEASGDGWKYRGRGLIQLTGKCNYDACGKAIGLDLLGNPDLLTESAEASVLAACWFWNKNGLNQFADKDDITTITKRINGGTNGLEDRKSNLTKAKCELL